MSLYPTIGAEDLVEKYGSPLEVAVALIKGKIDSYEQYFVTDVIGPTMIAAAKAQLELGIKTKKKRVKKT